MNPDSENRFVSHPNGVVIDTLHNLMWTKTDTMNDFEKWVNYQESVDYVRELNDNKFAGYDDWRLPNRDEMATLYDASFAIKDKFGKDVHISDRFESGGGFSMIAAQVPGRQRTWVFTLRDGQYGQPDGLWTLTESARACRNIQAEEK